MKNIAVLAQSLTVDYALEVIRGITSFFEDKDARVFLTQTQYPSMYNGIFEYQYWSGAELLESHQIDAAVIISGSYASYLSGEQLKELFKPYSKKSVVSVAYDLGYKKSVYTVVQCEDVYSQIVKHLIEVHGCKKIAFMSANLSKSSEAQERFDAYKKVLEQNGLEYDPSIVFDGNFTTSSALLSLQNNITSKEQVTFDAIIAANDLMALGCINFFNGLGLNVPEKMKVIGFDDTYHARISTPSISTISQQLFNQGRHAAEITWDIVNGKHVERKNVISLFPKMRQSCGCIELGSKINEFRKIDGSLCPEEADTYMEKYQRHFSEIHTIYTLFDTIHTAGGLDALYTSFRFLVQQMDMSSMAVFVYPEPVKCERGNRPVLPKTARLLMFFDEHTGVQKFDSDIILNIEENLFPEGIHEVPNGTYMLSPLFAGTLQYGYVVSRAKKEDYEVYNIYLKILNNMVINSYEFTKTYSKALSLENENRNLLISNSDLDLRAKTDELTGILNRRGFYELGQDTINVSIRMNRKGIVFFADMDGLKTINDTYGHESGDRAIKAQSEVLKRALRSTDIIGRLSGDEFAFIASGMPLEQVEELRKKINVLSSRVALEYKLPFAFSISIGAVEFNESNSKLQNLLVLADRNLYKEKKQKKSNQNETENKTSRL